MTINMQIETITNAIEALSVSGVVIRDIDNVPEHVRLSGPILFPRPNEFITDIEFTRVSQGGGGTAQMNVSYTLNYVYCHAPIGSGVGGLASVYSGMILEKLFASDNPTGAIDMTVESISNVAVVSDPAGNQYNGVEIGLRITEFLQ